MKPLRWAAPAAVICLSLALGACATGSPRASAGAELQQRIAAMERGLRPMVLEPGEAPPQWTLAERMAHYHVPGLAVAILRNGEVVYAAGYGVREAGTQDRVDGDTLFSSGSVSKMVTAAMTLRLVDQGTLALDTDVNTYLRRWQIPAAVGITHGRQPTLRMLMSHTSGLGQHGFKDYAPGLPLPTALQVLDGLAPAKNAPVRFEYEPGTRAQYSGGGTTVTQVLIEDVTQKSFVEMAQKLVFDPLGLTRSNFENPLSPGRGNIAKAHDDQGRSAAAPPGWQSMPELAASGLWTSAHELGVFTAALIRSYRGESPFLAQRTAAQMMTEVARSGRGLGPGLEGAGDERIFHHGGANDSYKAWIEGNLVTGDGIVILTNGAEGGDLGRELRNAAADAFGWGINPLIRTVALDYADPRYQDYAGSYRLEKNFLALQGVAVPETVKPLVIAMNGNSPNMTLGEDTSRLFALSTNRFVAPDMPAQALSRQLEFHRDADGVVRGVTVDVGRARFYYIKEMH